MGTGVCDLALQCVEKYSNKFHCQFKFSSKGILKMTTKMFSILRHLKISHLNTSTPNMNELINQSTINYMHLKFLFKCKYKTKTTSFCFYFLFYHKIPIHESKVLVMGCVIIAHLDLPMR